MKRESVSSSPTSATFLPLANSRIALPGIPASISLSTSRWPSSDSSVRAQTTNALECMDGSGDLSMIRTSNPCVRSAMALASPVGPDPTTKAVPMEEAVMSGETPSGAQHTRSMVQAVHDRRDQHAELPEEFAKTHGLASDPNDRADHQSSETR